MDVSSYMLVSVSCMSVCSFVELNNAWQALSSKFFVAVLLLSLSSLCYLTASLMDPGYMPMTFSTPSVHKLSLESLKERAQVSFVEMLRKEVSFLLGLMMA